MKLDIAFPRPRTLILINVVCLMAFLVIVPHQVPFWLSYLAHCARATVALSVVVAYGWSILQICRNNDDDPSNGLVIGIFLAFSADLYSSVQSLVWRWYDRPGDWPTLALWQVPVFLTILAGIHHLAVPDAINGRIPSRSLIWIGVAFGLACMAAGVLIGVQLSYSGFGPF